MKSLAFAADAEELIFLYGFSMASMGFQWPFRHLIAQGVPEAGSLRNVAQHREAYYRSNRKSCGGEKQPSHEHAIASVAPATSSKSPFHLLTR